MSSAETTASPLTAGAPASFRSLALPVEHGGWGLLLEPVVLGLLVAPSSAGAALAVATILAFLARHPLKLSLGDRRRGRRTARTLLAERIACAYGVGAATAFATAMVQADLPFWPVLAGAAPFGLVQLAYDARLRSRDLVPELAGAVAVGAVAPAMGLAAGWSLGPALGLWGVLAARAVPSILFVRARLRLDRGLSVETLPSTLGHLAGLILAVGLAASGLAPWLATVAFGLLLLRAVHGLSAARRLVRPQVLGFREVGYGALTVALLGLGCRIPF